MRVILYKEINCIAVLVLVGEAQNQVMSESLKSTFIYILQLVSFMDEKNDTGGLRDLSEITESIFRQIETQTLD